MIELYLAIATGWMILTFLLGMTALYYIITDGLDFIHTVCDDLFDSMGKYR